MAKRVGVLGGTFDPIHLGHLIVGEEVRGRLELDQVIYIPTGQPWLREERPMSSGAHRLAMVKLAIASNPGFSCSSIELDRSGPSYSVDTLRSLHQQLGSSSDLYFILGLDSLRTFPDWRDPQEIVSLCTLAAVCRPGHEGVGVEGLEEAVPGISHRLLLLDGPGIGISGTEIRRRLAQGMSIRYWVPREVEGYIRENGLYEARQASPARGARK